MYLHLHIIVKIYVAKFGDNVKSTYKLINGFNRS